MLPVSRAFVHARFFRDFYAYVLLNVTLYRKLKRKGERMPEFIWLIIGAVVASPSLRRHPLPGQRIHEASGARGRIRGERRETTSRNAAPRGHHRSEGRSFKLKSDADKEIKDRRAEITRQERRIDQKEEALDKRTAQMERKEEDLKRRSETVEARLDELEQLKLRQTEKLEPSPPCPRRTPAPCCSSWSMTS